MSGALGRKIPDDRYDWSHLETHPLSFATAQALPPRPVAIGINWYSNFDRPVKRGNAYYIGEGDLGSIRGGHCVCLKPRGAADPTSWWEFYNQGNEGACVGFGCSRMMSHLNRKRYFARWLWDWSKATDEWPETNPGDDEGTSVHAAADILRKRGHVAWKPSYSSLNDEASDFAQRDQIAPSSQEGIVSVQWATGADAVAEVLGYSGVGYVDVLNSWGTGYPHMVRMPLATLDRVIREDGEAAVVIDRP